MRAFLSIRHNCDGSLCVASQEFIDLAAVREFFLGYVSCGPKLLVEPINQRRSTSIHVALLGTEGKQFQGEDFVRPVNFRSLAGDYRHGYSFGLIVVAKE